MKWKEDELSLIHISLTTDDGINLFKPGKKPEENKLFQLVLACTMAAVDRHAVLLRLAASNTGNDHRLGCLLYTSRCV